MLVLKKIENSYHSFSKKELLIADYILKNPNEVASISIQELSKILSVSTATISRFAKKIGCQSHQQLKVFITTELALEKERQLEEHSSLSWENDMEEISMKYIPALSIFFESTFAINNIEDIKKGVKIISDAPQVYLYGLGSSILAAKNLNLNLLRFSKKSLFLEDSNFSLQNLGCAAPDDCLILISYSGETEAIKTTLKTAKKIGMKVIFITKFSNNPLLDLADLVLYCPNTSSSNARLFSLMQKYAQLLLTDLLFIGYAKSTSENPEETILDYIDKYFFIEYKRDV